jgi:hypothetical protein
VIALPSAGMVIGYIDRSNLSVVVATSEVRQAFHLNLSDAIRGLLNSTFFWSYALLQIPAGWVDRYGVRKPYAIAKCAGQNSPDQRASEQLRESDVLFHRPWRIRMGSGIAGLN